MTGSAGKLRALDGYVADSCYPSQFHQSFQPSWTDWNLERRGLAAPRTGRKPFKLVDLGCGDAHGLLLTAASHPEGQFVGIDAAPEHIARGHELAVAAGLTNVELRCADFRRARHFADESADYVTAQGVLAWVSPQNRSRLLDLAARWLRPGGAFTLGYNACPGWGRLAPFQKLVHALAQSASGTSSQRFTAALNRIRGDGMLPSEFWEWFDAQTDRHPPEYFAHEYLNDHWNPCWSSDVVSGMVQRGFAYVGQAIAVRLREDLYLKPEWRQTLATIGDSPTRELATDLLADTWYPGWIATVDGVPAPILRANYLFRGVPVPAGEHVVTMRFQPASLRTGLLVTAVAVVGLLLLLLVGLLLRRGKAGKKQVG